MTKTYDAVVKEGKIFLNEPTDLPDGTNLELVEKKPSHQPLIKQIQQEKLASLISRNTLLSLTLGQLKVKQKKSPIYIAECIM